MSAEERQAKNQKKSILGIIASERRLGNCEVFTKEICRQLPEEHELRLVRLPELTIRPCRGCYRCIAEERCPISDDLDFLIDAMAEADGVIIAAPVYFLGVHASLKLLLDRGFAFHRALAETEKKPCLLVTTYGIQDRAGVGRQALHVLAAFLCFDIKGSVTVQAPLPGDAVKSKRNREMARTLAHNLFSARSVKQAGFCPYCGMDVVQRKGTDFLCTLCHGIFSLDDQQQPVPVKPGWKISSSGFVREHRRWLKGMKDKFLAQRKEIVARTAPYKSDGTWILPGQKGRAEG